LAAHGSEAGGRSKGEARLALLVDVPAPYRIPVFNHIADRVGSRFKVFFMTLRPPNRQWESSLEQGAFGYEVLGGLNLRAWSTRGFGCHLNPRVGGALKRFAPSLVVVGGYNHATSFLAAWHLRKLPAKLCLWCESTLHDARGNSRLVERLKAWFIGRCDGFIVPGRASREYLAAYGVPDDRVFVAPNAVDSEFFRERAAKAQTGEARERFRKAHALPGFNSLFVGRLAPEKGFPVAVDAVSELQAQGLEVGLLVVGDGPLRREYEKLVSDRRLRHAVFLGFVQQAELPFYYGQTDVLIVPSVSEPWGLVVNEAMACGVPVLCSPAVGAGYDLVVDGATGYRCSSSAEYATRIRGLIEDPQSRSVMSERCRDAISAFSPDACAQGFLEALKVLSPEKSQRC
jgi:glycosyltransferase involved in cell wall biosynthesis